MALHLILFELAFTRFWVSAILVWTDKKKYQRKSWYEGKLFPESRATDGTKMARIIEGKIEKVIWKIRVATCEIS